MTLAGAASTVAAPARPTTCLPALGLLLNALIWGCSWWPLRQLQAHGLHPLWATAAVYSLAVLAIVVLRPQAVGQLLRTPTLWLLMAAAGTTNAAFNWGITSGDVVRVVLLFYLMPLWAVLLARWLLKEPLTALAALRVVLALVGAAIVLSPVGATDGAAGAAVSASSGWAALPLPQSLPDWLGLVGGISFALNNVLLKREAARPEEGRALAMFVGGMAVSGLLATLLATQAQAAWPPAPRADWVLLATGLAVLFLASNVALQYGASRLPANTTAVIMLSEVVFAAGSAAWWGGASIGAPLWIGGGLIIAAALLAAAGKAPRPLP